MMDDKIKFEEICKNKIPPGFVLLDGTLSSFVLPGLPGKQIGVVPVFRHQCRMAALLHQPAVL